LGISAAPLRFAPVENIAMKGPLNSRSLHCASLRLIG
jgi:hypothetical protein